MRIGFIVQGSTDRAFLTGLRDRWCPGADLEEALFRGDINPRQYRKACFAAFERGVDVMVVLTDSDKRKWAAVHKEEAKHIDELRGWMVVHGVADRNVECWICADIGHAAKVLHVTEEELRVDNPKRAFERARGITRDDKKETEIARMVTEMPSMKTLLAMPSFKHFYESVRDLAQRRGCTVPNEFEAEPVPRQT